MKRTLLLASVFTSATIVASAALAPAAGAASTLRVCKSDCRFKTIQAAINAATSGATILIEPGTYRENLVIGPNTATPLTLRAAGQSGDDDERDDDEHGQALVIVDGHQNGSVLAVSAGKTVTVIRLTLQNGKVTGNGGGISNIGGNVTVRKSRIVNNTAMGSIDANQGFGGAIVSTDTLDPTKPGPTPTLKVFSTVVSGNTATNGGGISTISLTANANAELTKVIVRHNTATTGGAGGVQNCGTLKMTDSLIRDNTATQGGGLTNCQTPGSTAQVKETPIIDNHAVGTTPTFPGGPPAGHGGGISNAGVLTLVESPVKDNDARGPGGGIFNQGGKITLDDSPVTQNHAGSAGGGIFNAQPPSPPGTPAPPPGTVARHDSPVARNTPDNCAGVNLTCTGSLS